MQKSKGRCCKKLPHVILISIALLALVAVICAGIVLSASSDSAGKIGSVNGLPVYAEELVMYADELRASVSARVSAEYGLSGTGPSFWDTQYGGVTPRETLLDLAMEEVVRSKVIQQQCIQHGITVPADFLQMQQAMQEENASRQSAAASGAVVYGTASYTLSQYSEYVMTMAEDDLKTALLEGELRPTEKQLQDAFDSLDESYKRKDFTCSGWRIFWPAEEGGEEVAAEIEQLLERGTAPDQLSGQLPFVSAEEFDFDSTAVHREDSSAITRSELLFFTEKNTCSEIEWSEDASVYYVEEKEGGGYYTLEEAPRLGESKYINDAFDELIDSAVSEAEIELDRDAALEALRALV